MESNVNYTIVGATIVFLFACIVLGIIWLSAGLSLEHYKTYAIYMEESVSGLSVDAAVEYNGVSVGTVSKVSLNPRNPHLVRLLISVKDDTPITQETVATINTRGLTGIAYIALKDNGSNMTPLVAATGQTYPVIKTAPSLFSRLDTGLGKLNTSLYELSNSVQSLLDDENRRAIKQTLLNLSKITDNLVGESKKLGVVIDNTAAASAQFPALVQSSQSAIQTLATQTLPAANRAMIGLDGVTQNMLDITNELKQNPAVLIRGKTAAPMGPGER